MNWAGRRSRTASVSGRAVGLDAVDAGAHLRRRRGRLVHRLGATPVGRGSGDPCSPICSNRTAGESTALGRPAWCAQEVRRRTAPRPAGTGRCRGHGTRQRRPDRAAPSGRRLRHRRDPAGIHADHGEGRGRGCEGCEHTSSRHGAGGRRRPAPAVTSDSGFVRPPAPRKPLKPNKPWNCSRGDRAASSPRVHSPPDGAPWVQG